MSKGVTNPQMEDDLEEGDLEVAFHLACRVPDASDPNFQPVATQVKRSEEPCKLGCLPTKSQELSEYLLPLDTNDAMSIHLKSTQKFKLKIKVGSVNVATTWRSKAPSSVIEHSQDYFLAPDQGWIDGFVVADDTAGQFVVLNPGTKFSAEYQVTGKDEIHNVEVEVFLPTRPPSPPIQSSALAASDGNSPSPPSSEAGIGRPLTPHFRPLSAGHAFGRNTSSAGVGGLLLSKRPSPTYEYGAAGDGLGGSSLSAGHAFGRNTSSAGVGGLLRPSPTYEYGAAVSANHNADAAPAAGSAGHTMNSCFELEGDSYPELDGDEGLEEQPIGTAVHHHRVVDIMIPPPSPGAYLVPGPHPSRPSLEVARGGLVKQTFVRDDAPTKVDYKPVHVFKVRVVDSGQFKRETRSEPEKPQLPQPTEDPGQLPQGMIDHTIKSIAECNEKNPTNVRFLKRDHFDSRGANAAATEGVGDQAHITQVSMVKRAVFKRETNERSRTHTMSLFTTQQIQLDDKKIYPIQNHKEEPAGEAGEPQKPKLGAASSSSENGPSGDPPKALSRWATIRNLLCCGKADE